MVTRHKPITGIPNVPSAAVGGADWDRAHVASAFHGTGIPHGGESQGWGVAVDTPATSGAFTFIIDGIESDPIAWNNTLGEAVTILEGHPSIGPGNIDDWGDGLGISLAVAGYLDFRLRGALMEASLTVVLGTTTIVPTLHFTFSPFVPGVPDGGQVGDIYTDDVSRNTYQLVGSLDNDDNLFDAPRWVPFFDRFETGSGPSNMDAAGLWIGKGPGGVFPRSILSILGGQAQLGTDDGTNHNAIFQSFSGAHARLRAAADALGNHATVEALTTADAPVVSLTTELANSIAEVLELGAGAVRLQHRDAFGVTREDVHLSEADGFEVTISEASAALSVHLQARDGGFGGEGAVTGVPRWVLDFGPDQIDITKVAADTGQPAEVLFMGDHIFETYVLDASVALRAMFHMDVDTASLTHYNAAGVTKGVVTLDDLGTTLGNGVVNMPSLPTADPHVVGQLWNSAGTLKVSAG